MRFAVLCAALLVAPLAAQQCSFTLIPSTKSVPASPDFVGSFDVTASSQSCARTAISDSDWLTVSFGSPGTGNGMVGYRVATNRTPSARSSSITVGNARFTVTQTGANCTIDLSPLSASVLSTAGRGSVRVTTSCDWTASSSVPWLTITSGASGSGNGVVDYSYSENTTTSARTGLLTVGSRTFSLTQAAAGCTVRLTPASMDFSGDGGTGNIGVTSTCSWTASSVATWISIISGASVNGNGNVSYRVAANPAAQARTATIQIGDQTFAVSQAGTLGPVIAGVAHAASFVKDLASPGSVVALFGARLGPTDLTNAQLTPDGLFLTKELAGTQVLFDGASAPMVFTLDTIVAAVVPYSTSGKRNVKVTVTYQGRTSPEYTLPIQAVAPGLYTSAASGAGQGAIFNEDLSLNSAGNPAARGSTVVLYGTGEGVTNPPGVDGKLNGIDLPAPVAPVVVSIGGALATVTYKGGVYGVTPGLLQINAIVPQAVTPGPSVPVFVTIGGVQSQAGVTLAVK